MTGLEIVLPALIPVVTDAIRGVINRFSGGAGALPANVGEVIQLMQADTARLQALADIDRAGDISRWVANFRAIIRPGSAVAIISAYLLAIAIKADPEIIAGLQDYAGMVTFYFFGDRAYTYTKKGR